MNTIPVEILSNRHNPGIDPTLHVWGWEIPVYLFLGGVVAGIMVLLAGRELVHRRAWSRRLRLAPLAAIALLSAGMGALFLDLSYKVHVLRFYATFRPTSPMSWGSWLLLLVVPALILLGVGALHSEDVAWVRARLGEGRIAVAWERVRAFSVRWRRSILAATLLLGIGLGTYTGILLGTLASRPLWNSSLLGPLFLTSGISTGAAFLLLMRPESDEIHALVRYDLVAIVVEVVLLGLFLVGAKTGGALSSAGVAPLLGGAWTPWFWSLVVALGLAVPALLESAEIVLGLVSTRWSPVLVLVGGLALRAILVAAGQETSVHMLTLISP